MRQAGLPGGAQLQLVQGSRSPTVIAVALQIPYLTSSRRVTEKFPSSHSIWQILRAVETKEGLNFTQRAEAKISDANSSSGRFFYEMPVVNVVNRELNCFADLQKTLSQLGVTSGNVLMRLSFKTSTQPLEDAMQEITQFFKEETPAEAESSIGTPVPSAAKQENIDPSQSTSTTADTSILDAPVESTDPPTSTDFNHTNTQDVEMESAPEPTTPSKPSITVYKAPTSIPAAAKVDYNEHDYVPTVEHAAIHQSRLQEYSRNRRLPSDAELAAKEQEKKAKLDAVQNVEVRIRFPDETQIKVDFTRGSSAHDVYEIVRSQMQKPETKFLIRYVDAKGAHVVLPDDNNHDLIVKASWRGRVLANMEWDSSVPPEARKGPVLTSEVLKQAQHLPVPVEPKDPNQPEESKGNFLGNLFKKDGQQKSNMTGAEKEDKMKKFLRFGKK